MTTQADRCPLHGARHCGGESGHYECGCALPAPPPSAGTETERLVMSLVAAAIAHGRGSSVESATKVDAARADLLAHVSRVREEALEEAAGVVFDAICAYCEHELDMERLRERIRSLSTKGTADERKP